MSFSMRHRGPDDLGYAGLGRDGRLHLSRDARSISGAWVGLAHRRLSIIDLTEEAWQPMASSDGRYIIVYNGEVYNYVELRDELEQLGYRFRSTSDTEVVLQAYLHWGKDALNRFIGMFAFAILDIEAREIFLCRDHFGIKPLYYVFNNGMFAFASEIKTLLQVPQISRRANAQMVFDYLRFAQNDYEDQTFFEDIYQIPPAHFLKISMEGESQAVPARYWDLDLTQTTGLSFGEASRRLRDILMENVRLHLRSDVPVGAALSGGVDSSSIIACMRELNPRADLHAFTYLPDTPDQGEKRWALETSEKVRSVFHMTQPSDHDLVKDLERLVYVLDQPFGSTNMYGQYLVYRLAQENGVKVILDGQGADELMAGYGHFYADRSWSLLHQGKISSLARFLWSTSRAQPGFNAARTLLNCSSRLLPPSVENTCRRLCGRGICPDWTDERWLATHGVQLKSKTNGHDGSSLRGRLYNSLMVDSLPMLLRWQDRNSMAHSVESRVPFLTPNLAQFVFSLPEDYLISKDGMRKAVLRSAMNGLVPDSVLVRRDKVAFGSPMQAWLRRLIPWISDVINSDIVHHIGIFDAKELQQIWQQTAHEKYPLAGLVWRWVSLIKWVECFDVQWDNTSMATHNVSVHPSL